jgi:hypothetical protein
MRELEVLIGLVLAARRPSLGVNPGRSNAIVGDSSMFAGPRGSSRAQRADSETAARSVDGSTWLAPGRSVWADRREVFVAAPLGERI